MKNDTLLTTTSLFAIVLTMCHLADDVVRGFDPAGLNNLTGIAILLVWLVAAVLLIGRRVGYALLFFGSLLATVIPALHFSGKGVGAIAQTPGGYFFIWTLFALGVTGSFALILSVRGLWSLRGRRSAA